jgi:uncharacterized membrane protein YkvI
MKKYFILLSLLAVVAITNGCAMNQLRDWDLPQNQNVELISDVVRDLLVGNIEVEEQIKVCIVECSIVGIIEYIKVDNETFTEKLKKAAAKSELRFQAKYPVLAEKYGSFDKLVLKTIVNVVGDGNGKWVEIEFNRSEIILSIIHAVLDNNLLPDLIKS